MKTVYKWILFFLVVPGLGFLSFYFLEKNKIFSLKNIQIEIITLEQQKRFPQPYVEKLQNQFEIFKGQSLWNLSLNAFTVVLKQEKWIDQFRISRNWPSQINIVIYPHEISYLLVRPKLISQGLFIPVTRSAELLNAIDSTQTPSLSLLKGEDFFKDIEKRKKAIDLLESIPKKGILSSKNIEEVLFDRTEGYWLKIVDLETKIKFGETDFQIKSARISEVLNYLEKKDLKARVIDANLSKKVLVRLH